MSRQSRPRRLTVAALLAAIGLVVAFLLGCSAQEVVEQSRELRGRIQVLEQELARLRADFPDFHATIDRLEMRIRRARDSVAFVQAQDPILHQILVEPVGELQEALDEVREARRMMGDMQRRVEAIHGGASMALSRADALVNSAVDLNNRMNIMRTLTGALGIPLPGFLGGGGGGQGDGGGGGSDPLGYILGTSLSLGTLGAAGYAGYRVVDHNRRKKEAEHDGGRTNTTNNVTVSIPPPTPSRYAGGAAHGRPPPTAGSGVTMPTSSSMGYPPMAYMTDPRAVTAHAQQAAVAMQARYGQAPQPMPGPYSPPLGAPMHRDDVTLPPHHG